MRPSSLTGIGLDLLEQDALCSYARRERERHAGLVPGLSLRQRGVVALEHPATQKKYTNEKINK